MTHETTAPALTCQASLQETCCAIPGMETRQHLTSDSAPLQVRLAKRLVEQSFADKVFYANSGTEANEAAIKFSRKHARLAGSGMAPSWHAVQIPCQVTIILVSTPILWTQGGTVKPLSACKSFSQAWHGSE